MTEQPSTAARAQEQRASRESTRPPPRRRLRLAIVVCAVFASLALLSFYAPTYAVRYLIISALDAQGVEHEGIDTIRVNPWTLELWAGPVRFGLGSADPGQLGELDLNIRFDPLLERRISIERLLLREIDVTVTRSGENAIQLNGVPLHHLVPPLGVARQPEETGHVWSAGVDTFELRDSRLNFRDRDGGELELEVERLTLMDFNPWEPGRPGRFELVARVNDIRLDWSGEARPFADTITLAIDSRTEQIDLPKLARFTGPWGLDHSGGTYDARLKTSLTLPASGGLNGQAVGSIAVKDANYGRVKDSALTLEQAEVRLDLRYSSSEAGVVTLKGDLAADLGPASATFADRTNVSAVAGQVAMNGLDARFATDGALEVVGKTRVDLEGVGFSGPVEISIDKLLEPLILLQSLSAARDASLVDTGLSDFSGRTLAVPSSEAKVGRLVSDAENFILKSTEGRVELSMKTATDLANTEISVNETRIRFERWRGVFDPLNLTFWQGRAELSAVASSSLAAGASRGPRGEMKIDVLDADVGQFDVRVQAGAAALECAAVGRAKGFSGLAFAKDSLPEVRIDVGAARAGLARASIDTQGGVVRWRASGDVSAESLGATFARGQAGRLRLARAEVKALELSEPSRFTADTLSIDGADVTLTRSLLLPLFRDGGAASTKAKTPGAAAARLDVSKVQRLLAERGFDPGPVDGRMGPRTSEAIRAFQRREGLAVDGRFSTSLSRALEAPKARADGVSDRPDTRGDTAETGRSTLRLGRMAVTGTSALHFRDDVITPKVKLDSVFKEFQLRNLDTGDADQRADFSVTATVDGRTDVMLTGWVSGSMENADLDVTAKVENLHLPTYSPYFEKSAGVLLASGRLDGTAKIKGTKGNLQGEMRVAVADAGVRPVSGADAEQIIETVGIPLEIAVELLKDIDGNMALNLPITGRVNEPDVDMGPAVNRAVGNVLATVFPPTLIASMLASLVDENGSAFLSIEFSPGSAELREGGKNTANSLAKLLSEHPDLSITLCAPASRRDSNAVPSAVKIPPRQQTDPMGSFGDPGVSPLPDPAESGPGA